MEKQGVALLIGAAGDMGQKIAEELAGLGFDLALHYNTGKDRAEQLLARMTKAGVRADIFQADFVGGFDAPKLIADATAALGDISLVVFAHGSVGYCLLHEMDDSLWDRVVAVNLTAPYKVIKAIMPTFMARKRGKIIAVSGSIPHVGAVGRTHVAASKAGLEMLVKSVARELGPYGVTANLVAPGPTNTRLILESNHPRYREPEDLPLRRYADIDDIANAIAFLASDKAKNITGQTLMVNCGDVISSA